MFQIILISSTLICTLPAHVRARSYVTERIVNSWDADEWRYSHVVAITNRYTDYVECGGSILTTSIVLTACHCFLRPDTNTFVPSYLYFAKAGVHNLLARKGRQVRNFREKNAFVVHRKCDLTIPISGYDVGLGFLEKPFKLTKTIRLVKFISTDEQTLWFWLNRFRKRKKLCHIVGWGYTNFTTKHLPLKLKDGRVTLVSQQDCEEYTCSFFEYCDNIVTKENIVCTTPYEKSMTCNKDSGGPLMCDEYIFGIVNSGREGCNVSDLVPTFYCNPLTILAFIRYYVPDYIAIPFPIRRDPPSVVAPFKYPFVVSIANVSNIYIPRSICAGSILTKSAVIAPCECVMKLEESFSLITMSYEDVAVVSGTKKLFEDSLYKQQLKITRLEHRCKSSEIGIGIVYVDGEFPFATRLVKPLKMPSDDVAIVRKHIKTFLRPGKKCLMTTWGYMVENPTEIQYNVFTEWEIRLKSMKDCKSRELSSATIDRLTKIKYNYETLCGEAHGNVDFCDGDSGGPLICEGYFIGVVIFNGDLCYRNNSLIFTSLLGILDLVKKVIPEYSVRNIVSESKGSWIPMPSGILWYIIFLLIPFVSDFVFK